MSKWQRSPFCSEQYQVIKNNKSVREIDRATSPLLCEARPSKELLFLFSYNNDDDNNKYEMK